MNDSTVTPAESSSMQANLSWPDFLLISLVVAAVVFLAIFAARHHRRMMLVTEVLR